MEAETAWLRAAEIGPVGREGTGSARVGLSLLRYSGSMGRRLRSPSQC